MPYYGGFFSVFFCSRAFELGMCFFLGGGGYFLQGLLPRVFFLTPFFQWQITGGVWGCIFSSWLFTGFSCNGCFLSRIYYRECFSEGGVFLMGFITVRYWYIVFFSWGIFSP